MLAKPHMLTFLTTNQCTARCAHCSMFSGPERKERLTFDQMRRAIESAHESFPLRVVVFAGGEPTLLGEDLLSAIAYASSRGLLTRMVSNASFATSDKAAYAKLAALWEAGLHEVNFSCDDYHLEYVPFDRIRRVWNASKEIDFDAVVIANSTGRNSSINPDTIQELLGEKVQLVYDDDGFRRDLARDATQGRIYAIGNSRLQPLGRAASVMVASDLIEFAGRTPGPCPNAVQNPAVSASNHLLGCCGAYMQDNPILDFGTLDTIRIPERIRAADESAIVTALRVRGPAYLRDFVQRHAPHLTFNRPLASMCAVCEEVVGRPDCLEVLFQHYIELAADVYPYRQCAAESSACNASRSSQSRTPGRGGPGEATADA